MDIQHKKLERTSIGMNAILERNDTWNSFNLVKADGNIFIEICIR